MARNKVAWRWTIIGFALLLFLPIWWWCISPELTKIPDDFEYNAVLFSRDNFYDADQKEFGGEFISNTEYYYQVVEKYKGILFIKNVFAVQQYSGEEIINVERMYGVDAKTRKHVPGYGDRDRQGYLFAPPNLKKGQNFTYLHYDIYALLFGIIIVNFAVNTKRLFSLENTWLNYLGQISYGIYMYHSILIVLSLKLIQKYDLPFYLIYPLTLLLTVFLAGLSYRYFENKCLRYKASYSRIISGDSVKIKKDVR